ncbi:hypothetical protein CFP65_2718 [Kitasatospora sp. MMS16-BH015]|uniref:DUF4350 domain-containing protein n=1 Tax=Kitasatospora sp. MMS16-BH015 TaxID=2018025 RepID=UPI000CA39F63|nr:DUF4350 domain-containing protein [Kitasatospora sp. MMS16-BH015]AUG77539.1 hypothetical protein CFP65_2718 [Kitasatospora sp. MMS16-BH015]
MTTGTETPTPTPAPSGTSLAPTARRLWDRTRWYLLATAVLLLAALLITGLGTHRSYPPLDPRSTDPDGTHAAVQLLRTQGLTVRQDTDLEDALTTPDSTLVLVAPDRLSPAELAQIASTRRGDRTRLVLIAAGPAALDALAPTVTLPTDENGLPAGLPSAEVPADCALPEAQRAGPAELGGYLYHPGPAGLGCYPRPGGTPLVRVADGTDRDTVLLGSGRLLTNERLAKSGNAALTLGLLGAHQNLIWYLPDPAEGGAAPAADQHTLGDYLPRGWYWAGLQLAVAAVLAALWRARRLGPVVTEELPAVVRATETTEGRARLYQRARARGRAAEALRTAARHRLALALRLPLTHGAPDPTALVAATADRTTRPAAELHTLLYGPAPADDTALLRLTDHLDALERQVRQP